ncbi:MAG TPA: tryptophan synthase subunit alpha [Anaerolineales bacterium]|nr:tryptophan synthase subunit alpha [Anaerolineales bacterium]
MSDRPGSLAEAFEAGSPAVMPYFPIGYPDFESSFRIIERLYETGADIIEVGIPFSDPLADGPTIQAATQAALASGASMQSCLDGVAKLRKRGVTTPLVVMSYFNPIYQFGLREFALACSGGLADGVIIPDLPPEEANEWIGYARDANLNTIFLVAPNSSDERITLISGVTTGFLYLVSVAGVTGARGGLPEDLKGFVQRVRRITGLPLAVGFGISSSRQVAEVGALADGVIVGSALIDEVTRALLAGLDPAEAAGEFLLDLKRATTANPNR